MDRARLPDSLDRLTTVAVQNAYIPASTVELTVWYSQLEQTIHYAGIVSTIHAASCHSVLNPSPGDPCLMPRFQRHNLLFIKAGQKLPTMVKAPPMVFRRVPP